MDRKVWYVFFTLVLIVLVACTANKTGEVVLPGTQGCPSGTTACYHTGGESAFECCEEFETCTPNSDYDNINTCCPNAGGCSGEEKCCMDRTNPERRVFIPAENSCYVYAADDIEGHPVDDDWIPCPTPSSTS